VRALRVALLTLALCAATAAGVRATGVAGVQMRYWSFTNGSALRDGIVYLAPGPFHVQLEYRDPIGSDYQFRPEVGVHLRDHRRSVYTIQARKERDDIRFWLGTDQVVDRHWVARAEVSPIAFADSTLWAWDTGADFYWGSYHFASATLMRDPRAGGLWVVPVRVRLATESNDWVQFTLAPASRRTLGWAVDARWRIVRAGFERNSRFDFTSLDNTIFTAGIEVPLSRRR
jgi:hypothetical protein